MFDAYERTTGPICVPLLFNLTSPSESFRMKICLPFGPFCFSLRFTQLTEEAQLTIRDALHSNNQNYSRIGVEKIHIWYL